MEMSCAWAAVTPKLKAMEPMKSERLGACMILIMHGPFDAFATSSQTMLGGSTRGPSKEVRESVTGFCNVLAKQAF